MILLKGQTHDRTQSFFKEKKEKSRPNTRSRIKPISDKRAIEKEIYDQVKAEWREERKAIDGFKCQVEKDGVRCSRGASPDPHHKKGRTGTLLSATEYFLAVCYSCHRLIHQETGWAYENGYLLKRI